VKFGVNLSPALSLGSAGSHGWILFTLVLFSSKNDRNHLSRLKSLLFFFFPSGRHQLFFGRVGVESLSSPGENSPLIPFPPLVKESDPRPPLSCGPRRGSLSFSRSSGSFSGQKGEHHQKRSEDSCLFSRKGSRSFPGRVGNRLFAAEERSFLQMRLLIGRRKRSVLGQPPPSLV